jgi:methanogenic corrinoid protein MtbC1
MIINELLEAVRYGDTKSGFQLIEGWKVAHADANMMIQVIEPFLKRVGREWQSRQLSLAQTYLASKLAEDAIELFASGKKYNATLKGPVVIGNTEEDFHGLGRRLVAAFLKANNWEVLDMGNDVAADDFVEAACQANSHVIAVSAMMYTTALNIKKIRQAIDERGLSACIKLAVGGAVFRLRPELVREVGGDGSALTALDAHKLIEHLWNIALKNEEAQLS